MRGTRTGRGLLVAAVLFAGGWGWFRSADPDVEEGNRHYQAGEYDQALESYRAAAEHGDVAGIHHNMGAALYKQAEGEKDEAARTKLLEQAETELRKGAESDDPVLKSSAYHNLGNVQFQRGQLEEAVQSYKRALRANPDNDDARYNLELTLRKLHKDKPPPQPQQGQGQGQPQQGQGQGQDQKDQQGQGQDQKDQQGQGQGQDQKDQQGQGQDQKDGQGQGQDQKDQKDGQGQGQDQKDQKDGQGQDQKDQRDQKDQKDGQQQGQGQGQDGQEQTEDERKLDALEHSSRELRRQKMRNQSGRSPYRRVKPPRDW